MISCPTSIAYRIEGDDPAGIIYSPSLGWCIITIVIIVIMTIHGKMRIMTSGIEILRNLSADYMNTLSNASHPKICMQQARKTE
jgi:hypothetical protein